MKRHKPAPCSRRDVLRRGSAYVAASVTVMGGTAAGGSAAATTTAPAPTVTELVQPQAPVNRLPVFSADGRVVCLASGQATRQALYVGQSPRDGDYAYRRLFEPGMPVSLIESTAIGPDGRFLAFACKRMQDDGSGDLSIHVGDVAGGQCREVVRLIEARGKDARTLVPHDRKPLIALSPDGREVFFHSPGQGLVSVAADGGKVRVRHPLPAGAIVRGFTTAPDGAVTCLATTKEAPDKARRITVRAGDVGESSLDLGGLDLTGYLCQGLDLIAVVRRMAEPPAEVVVCSMTGRVLASLPADDAGHFRIPAAFLGRDRLILENVRLGGPEGTGTVRLVQWRFA